MKKFVLLLSFLALVATAKAQFIDSPTDPSGGCIQNEVAYSAASQTWWVCHQTGFLGGVPQYLWVQASSSSTGSVTASGSPVNGNIAKFTSATNVAPAAASNIVALFSTCSGIQYLGADGGCHTSGAVSSGTQYNLAYYATSTNVVSNSTITFNPATGLSVPAPSGTGVALTLTGDANSSDILDANCTGGSSGNCLKLTSAGTLNLGSNMTLTAAGAITAASTITGLTLATSQTGQGCVVEGGPSSNFGVSICAPLNNTTASYNFNLPDTAGTSGQPLLSAGGGTNDQTYGTLGIAAGGTNAVTAGAALINLFPTASEVGDLVYCSSYSSGCTAWTLLSGNTSTAGFLQETAGGVPSWVQSTSKMYLASQYTNSTTSATTILSTPLLSGNKYAIRCNGLWKSATSGYFGLTITGPTGTVITYNFNKCNTIASNACTYLTYSATGTSYPTGIAETAVGTAATDMPWDLELGITATSTATLAIQGISVTGDQLAVEAGSSCTVN